MRYPKRRDLSRFLIFLTFSLGSSLVFAAPDPRDSIIIESKTITTYQTSNPLTLRVWITNKDTLSVYQLSLVIRSISGGAFMTLGYPRAIGGAVRKLDSCMQSFSILVDTRYDNTPADTLVVAGFGISDDLELPNLTRKAFLELRFDSIQPNDGTIEVDSALVWFGASINSTGFVAPGGRGREVNFVKGRVIIKPVLMDLNADGISTLADLVLAINCKLSKNQSCDENITSMNVDSLIKAFFSGGSRITVRDIR